jgi:ribonuclease D
MSTELVDTSEALAEWRRVIAGSCSVALDTEGDSLHCYFEKLCLVQIGLPDHNILVDPLAAIDLSLLTRTLATKVLVLHGSDYDLRMLRRGLGFVATNIFDTYHAARLVGLPEVGYAALVKRFFGIELPKSSQKANWAKRPLTPTMREYALNDTRYLLELSEELGGLLLSKQRWSWFEETCRRAIASAAVDRDRDPDKAWKIAGSAALKDQASSVLRELWFWRDGEAREMDRPAYQILRNEDLIAIARRATETNSVELPGHLPSGRRRRLRESIEKALRLPESDWPRATSTPRLRSTAEQDRLFEILKSKRNKVAAELELDPGVVAPRQALERVARDPESKSEVLMSWQCELLGL